MILIPVLILQMFLFPLTVGWIMNTWVDSRRTLQLEEAAGQIGSSIQQVYYSLNHTTILDGTLTSKLNVLPFIEGYSYVGNATLREVLEPGLSSSKLLEITLTFVGADASATTSVTLGQNVQWNDDVPFLSNSTTNCCVTAEKNPDQTVLLYFGIPEG